MTNRTGRAIVLGGMPMSVGMRTGFTQTFCFVDVYGFSYVRNGKNHRQQPGENYSIYSISFHTRFTQKLGVKITV